MRTLSIQHGIDTESARWRRCPRVGSPCTVCLKNNHLKIGTTYRTAKKSQGITPPIPPLRDPSTTTLPLHRPLSHHLHIQCGRSRDLSTPVQLQNQRVVQVGKYHPSKYQTHLPSRYLNGLIFSVASAARSSSSHRLPADNHTSDSAWQRWDEVTKAGQPGVVVYSEPAITKLRSNMLLKDQNRILLIY